MASYIVKQKVNGQYATFAISDISETDLKKFVDLMIGEVLVFKSTSAVSTAKAEPYPTQLNTKVFSSGSKNGSVYDRDVWTIKHMSSGKGLKDVRALKSNLHASFNSTTKATYVNLISDKKV